jgi:hypothetical protein
MCKSYIHSVPSCMLISFPYNILLKGGDRNSILCLVKLLLSPERHIIKFFFFTRGSYLVVVILGGGTPMPKHQQWCVCVYIYIYIFFFHIDQTPNNYFQVVFIYIAKQWKIMYILGKHLSCRIFWKNKFFLQEMEH